ncbi:general secretion pathway protein GspB [Marinobacterium arenosum]|uniref:general secretion pathway protein GspB n=1 Tax=Marinobacterium arenosum TaxID=2862496 RepID=UPI001C96CA92|nr:general secretion pathway protein GspB [Marinobacterium arenosum]MBY4678272.1 general secretion pathway protein GspB [Marinobacterium arenosum]
MSFILDALKRSERERHRGDIPTLDSQHTELHQPDNSRNWLRYWPVIALLAAIGAILWLVVRTGTSPFAPVAAVTPAKAPMVDTDNKPRQQQPLPVKVADPPLRNDSWLLSVPSDIEKMKGVKIQLGEVDREAPLPGPTAKTTPVVRKTAPASQQLASTATAASATSATQADTAKPAALPQADPTTRAAVTNDRYRGLPNMRQLSPAEQRKIPAVTFTVHVYDKDPANRMVRMEGTTYREGMQLKPGLRLVEITPDGVVLNNQGTKFWRNILR